MEIVDKIKILKNLDTKDLIEKLHLYEDELERVMIEEANFKAKSRGFLGSGDCQEVKRILAELAVKVPETNEIGKKMTNPEKEQWLIRQREENEELNTAITKQRQVVFLLDDYQIKIEMTKKRLEGVKVVIILKTAQINFLASG